MPPKITRNLEPGSKGDDVKQLQQWLIGQGFKIPDGATGFYGPQTKSAVSQWQSSIGLDTAGNPGYFGPRSRSAVSYFQQTTQPEQSIQSIQPAIPTPTTTSPIASTTPSPASAQATPNTYDTGDDTLNGILNNFAQIIDSQLQAGKKINPNIVITPEVAQRFITQASAEVDPYYKTQFESIKGDLQTSLSDLGAQYERERAGKEAEFRTKLGLQIETAAQKGTAFSGGRARTLGELTAGTEGELTGLSAEALQRARTLGTTAERKIGSEALSGLSAPSIGAFTPTTTGRGGFTQTATRSLYTPQGGVIGSEERARAKERSLYQDYLRSRFLEEKGL